ncbi:MAG: Eco57I restriction-modification methylase domain-containing protein [Thermodesulfovibrionales bacterium]|nr:Eco57I restriction-modification methylase domain-containing protein [Thermodesulfovibrionales bacterium]
MNLSIFNNNLFEAGTEFFNQLGIRLNSNTASSLRAEELLKDHYKDKGIFKAIDEAYFLGLVDDSVFDGNIPLLNKEKISLKEAEDRLTAEYNGLMVFAVRLKDSYSPTRTEIAELTRAFNRVSKSVPVVLLLKYGGLLSFAASERTKYKQAWREGEKIGKISLLKDIKVAAPHTGHLKIIEDLKVAPAVTDFTALYKQWQEVFNVQLLNKSFYQELANWYFWALRNVEFPEDAEKNKDVRNAISVIRMITRLIFIWFVKEKGLIPDDLFNQAKLKSLLDFSDKNQSIYYMAILQNLFFATLNTEMNKDKPGSRKFRGKNKGNGRDQHYMIHNVFRYEDYFTNPQDTLKKYFEGIPFLNGGLFECLDKEIVGARFPRPQGTTMQQGGGTPPLQKKIIRIDGYSDRNDNPLKVPDHLFFSSEQSIDLNEVYGTKNKTYKVRGLIDILDSYKFTVDENTPIEEEIALDPELLGKVFENLLASYNPETQTTARKQTGSFYTPREIVNYMVDESIIAYLSTYLSTPPLQGGVTEGRGGFIGQPPRQTLSATPPYQGGELRETRLRHLVAYNDETHKFRPTEVDVLIDAINTLKALDPACGSGAFPMGMLHKLVYILGKLDPDNSKWREVQRQKAIKETEEAYNIGDKEEREKRLLDISEVFENNASDYGRKLYLIENCIFGVDIQPIAVQIAKLRFFVSLIVDQRIDPKKENLGVRPLPNLETKFVAANSLLDVLRPGQQLLRNLEIKAKEAELKKIRAQHFLARTPQTKNNCRVKDAKLRGEIAKLLEGDGWDKHTAQKLADWDPYDQNAWADFFDSEWMFGVTDGYDITIGNPPYVRADAGEEHLALRQRIIESKRYKTLWEKWDLFVPFIELGYQLLKPNGVTTMIVSDAYCHSKYAQKSQNWFLQNSRILRLDFLSKIKVFEAGVHNIVYFFQKSEDGNNMPERREHEDEFGKIKVLPTDEQKNLTYRAFFPEDGNVANFTVPTESLANVCYITKGMVVHANEKIDQGAFEMKDLVSETQDKVHPKPFVEGKHLDIWLPASNKWLEWGTKRAPALFSRPTFPELYEVAEKILVQRSPGPDPKACYDNRYLHFTESSVGFIPWHCLANVRNNSLKKVARYKGEKPPRHDLPKREELEITSRRFAVKYLLAVMNSSVARNFLRANRRSNIHLYPDDWKKLPIPNVPPEQQKPIAELVDQILAAKKKDPNTDTSALEKQIDEMVYALYGLTPEEITIVEGTK